MNVECLTLGHIAANCWLVSGETGALVIDPGTDSLKVSEFLVSNSDKECAVLLTHAHFDHIGGAQRLRQLFGTPIMIGEADAFALSDPEYNLSDRFRAHVAPFSADRLLQDGQKVKVGDLSFEVLETPGHTKGGVCILFDGILFSGDILFYGSIGRTDFPGSDPAQMFDSLNRLLYLPEDTRVLPGHGEETTIGRERRFNPYL